MKIKLVAVLVALLTAGAAFGLSPLAHAQVDNTRQGVVGPNVQVTADGDDQIGLTWDEIEWMADNTHLGGGYNLYRSTGAGDFDYVTTLDKDTRTYADSPGVGKFRYRLTAYLEVKAADAPSVDQDTTWHTEFGPVSEGVVGELAPAPRATPSQPKPNPKPEVIRPEIDTLDLYTTWEEFIKELNEPFPWEDYKPQNSVTSGDGSQDDAPTDPPGGPDPDPDPDPPPAPAGDGSGSEHDCCSGNDNQADDGTRDDGSGGAVRDGDDGDGLRG